MKPIIQDRPLQDCHESTTRDLTFHSGSPHPSIATKRADHLESDMSPPTLMTLPPELRLTIYDCLFTDIFRTSKDMDDKAYHLPASWPKNQQHSAFASLVGTCKTIAAEAVPLFEARYLPGLTVYLACADQLQRLHHSLAERRKAAPSQIDYQSHIHFNLRTTCKLASLDYRAQNAEILAFMNFFTDHAVDRRYVHTFHADRNFNPKVTGTHACEACGTALAVRRQGKVGVVHLIDHDLFRSREDTGDLQVVSKEIYAAGLKGGSLYVEMRGAIGGLREAVWSYMDERRKAGTKSGALSGVDYDEMLGVYGDEREDAAAGLAVRKEGDVRMGVRVLMKALQERV